MPPNDSTPAVVQLNKLGLGTEVGIELCKSVCHHYARAGRAGNNVERTFNEKWKKKFSQLGENVRRPRNIKLGKTKYIPDIRLKTSSKTIIIELKNCCTKEQATANQEDYNTIKTDSVTNIKKQFPDLSENQITEIKEQEFVVISRSTCDCGCGCSPNYTPFS